MSFVLVCNFLEKIIVFFFFLLKVEVQKSFDAFVVFKVGPLQLFNV